jgi:hypothetical protein
MGTRYGGAIVVVTIAAVAAIAGRAGASPTAFTLTFDGSHVFDATLPAGVRHEGPFTATSPFCSSGTARDVQDVVVEPPTVLREFDCDDDSGSMTVFMPSIRAEHGGSGSWRIVSGTGQYATLRGLGTYVSTLVSGDPLDFLSIKYHSTWTGVVDFDVDPPAVVLTARATKLRRPKGFYALRFILRVTNEAQGARLLYSVAVTAGTADLADRLGKTTSRSVTTTLRIKPRRTTRRVTLSIDVTDPVGNASKTKRTIALPR